MVTLFFYLTCRKDLQLFRVMLACSVLLSRLLLLHFYISARFFPDLFHSLNLGCGGWLLRDSSTGPRRDSLGIFVAEGKRVDGGRVALQRGEGLVGLRAQVVDEHGGVLALGAHCYREAVRVEGQRLKGLGVRTLYRLDLLLALHVVEVYLTVQTH